MHTEEAWIFSVISEMISRGGCEDEAGLVAWGMNGTSESEGKKLEIMRWTSTKTDARL
jgi:hypothetical protein